MHELSIAESIVRIASAHAGERRVVGVDVKVGQLRQVVPDALAFAFELVAARTLVEGAALNVDHVAVRVHCRACSTETPNDGFPLVCAQCESLDVEVIAGDELYVEALELEDEQVAPRETTASVGGR